MEVDLPTEEALRHGSDEISLPSSSSYRSNESLRDFDIFPARYSIHFKKLKELLPIDLDVMASKITNHLIRQMIIDIVENDDECFGKNIDIHGNDRVSIHKLQALCPVCRKFVGATKFSQHFEKCLGMGRAGKRNLKDGEEIPKDPKDPEHYYAYDSDVSSVLTPSECGEAKLGSEEEEEEDEHSKMDADQNHPEIELPEKTQDFPRSLFVKPGIDDLTTLPLPHERCTSGRLSGVTRLRKRIKQNNEKKRGSVKSKMTNSLETLQKSLVIPQEDEEMKEMEESEDLEMVILRATNDLLESCYDIFSVDKPENEQRIASIVEICESISQYHKDLDSENYDDDEEEEEDEEEDQFEDDSSESDEDQHLMKQILQWIISKYYLKLTSEKNKKLQNLFDKVQQKSTCDKLKELVDKYSLMCDELLNEDDRVPLTSEAYCKLLTRIMLTLADYPLDQKETPQDKEKFAKVLKLENLDAPLNPLNSDELSKQFRQFLSLTSKPHKSGAATEKLKSKARARKDQKKPKKKKKTPTVNLLESLELAHHGFEMLEIPVKKSYESFDLIEFDSDTSSR